MWCWVHFVEQGVGLVYYIFGLWNVICANFSLWFYAAPQRTFPHKQALVGFLNLRPCSVLEFSSCVAKFTFRVLVISYDVSFSV